MHDRVRNDLEDYLSGRLKGQASTEFHAHLGACSGCRDTVDAFEAQAQLVRCLRVDADELAPAPGFYARVMDRIDAQRATSPWSFFLQPLLMRRVAYVTLALFVFMGTSILLDSEDHAVLANDSNPVGVLAGYGMQPAHAQRGHDVVMAAVMSDATVHFVTVSE